MSRRRVLRWCAIVVGAALLVWGGVEVSVPPGSYFPPPGQEQGIAPIQLADRGAAATIGALRTLDACSLIDPVALAGTGAGDVDTSRDAPHTCSASSVVSSARVMVGAGFNAHARWSDAPIEVGGVRAYESRLSGDARACTVDIPVTFELGIQFEAMDLFHHSEPCPTARAVAAAAVPRLRSPVPVSPAAAPLADIDPCALLAATGPTGPVSTPTATSTPTSYESAAVDQCVEPTGEDTGFEFEIGYGKEVDSPYEQAGDCHRERAGPRPARGPGVVFGVWGNGHDCAAVGALLDRLAAAVPAAPRVSTPVRAVRLFAPQEPDTAMVGPCADLGAPECRNPTPVTVPDGVDERLSAGAADTSYTCALAGDAVHRAFGSGTRPTLYGDSCHFVDSRHEVDVAVTVSSFDPTDFRDDAGPVRRDIVLDDHQVRYRESASIVDGRTHAWYVKPWRGTAMPEGSVDGAVIVTITRHPPRGEILGGDGVPPDPELVARGDALVADLMREWLDDS